MYPIHYSFKKIALTNKLTVTDDTGNQLFYAHQKLLNIKEKIIVYTDSSKTSPIGELNADRVIDFSPLLTFTNTENQIISAVKRKGTKSLWRAHYEIMDATEQVAFTVREDNTLIKVLDALMASVPVLGLLSGYFFNPRYNVLNTNGEVVAQLSKKPSFFEASYELTCSSPKTDDPQNILPISILAVLTRERARG